MVYRQKVMAGAITQSYTFIKPTKIILISRCEATLVVKRCVTNVFQSLARATARPFLTNIQTDHMVKMKALFCILTRSFWQLAAKRESRSVNDGSLF